MNVSAILHDTWRITWKCWPLWALSVLMMVALAVAMTLAGMFGGLASLAASPLLGSRLLGLSELPQLPMWAWVLMAALTWALLVVATAISWILQVAMVRGAALAAEQGALTLGGALRLGRQRFASLIKLSLTFGVLMMALSVLPPLATVLIAQLGHDGQAGAVSVVQAAQTGLLPINSILSLALFLVMMSIAVEDLTPLKAFRRTWSVLRHGWWGFLLVFALSALPSLALLLLLLPLILTVPFIFFFQGGWIVPLLCGAGLMPVGLFILLFTAVFTTTMYTLIYRAAAQLSQPAAPATAPPD